MLKYKNFVFNPTTFHFEKKSYLKYFAINFGRNLTTLSQSGKVIFSITEGEKSTKNFLKQDSTLDKQAFDVSKPLVKTEIS